MVPRGISCGDELSPRERKTRHIHDGKQQSGEDSGSVDDQANRRLPGEPFPSRPDYNLDRLQPSEGNGTQCALPDQQRSSAHRSHGRSHYADDNCPPITAQLLSSQCNLPWLICTDDLR